MKSIFVCSMLLILSLPVTAFGEDPEYFRRDGGVSSSEEPLPNDFTEDAKLVWRTQLPLGHSTPCVHGDRIYLTTFNPEKEELATVALDRNTGKQVWAQRCPAERIEPYHRAGSPASASVATNGELVFSFFGSYGLLAYDREGKLVWSKPMGPFQDEFGASSSPALVDDLVVLNEDHDVGSYLIAIDQKTGDTRWRTSREEFTRSYSSPVIWHPDGKSKQVVVAGSLQVAGYDVRTGKKLWWVDGLSRIVDVTPVILDDSLYIATWTPGGDQTERIRMEPFSEALSAFDRNGDKKIAKSELPKDSPVVPRFFRMDLDQDQALDADEWARHASVFERAQNAAQRIELGGQGSLTEKSVRWTFHKFLPTVPSSVVYKGALYMVKDGGIIASLDAKTGELLKTGRSPKGRGNYYASLVAGDDKVFLCSEGGVVTVLKATPQWTVLASHDFGERITATPAIVNGRVYIRTDIALYCFEKR